MSLHAASDVHTAKKQTKASVGVPNCSASLFNVNLGKSVQFAFASCLEIAHCDGILKNHLKSLAVA